MTKRNGQTLHQYILSELQNNIVSGKWHPGHRLPFEVNLAKQYGCSRMTVNKVMTQLVAAGLIERKRKSGSFVRLPESQSAILPINEISAEVESLGLNYHWTILNLEKRLSHPDENAKLSLSQSGVILLVDCLHFANNQPFCLEQRIINLNSVPKAENANFNKTPPGNWLVDSVPWSFAKNRISAISADINIAKKLEITEHSACLLVERLTRDNIKTITYVRLIYSGKRHSIVALFEPTNDAI